MVHRLILMSLFVWTLFLSNFMAHAETRLFVPEFTVGPQANTQFLLINANAHDSQVDLWAFSSKGELLGQVRLGLKPHSTRAITVREAFGLDGMEVKGWLGAVSAEGNIQISYQRTGRASSESAPSSDAVEGIFKEIVLGLLNRSGEVLRLSNPNSFQAHVIANGLDQNGRFVGRHAFTIEPFAQTEINVEPTLGDGVKGVDLFSDADLLSAVGAEFQRSNSARDVATVAEADELALVIKSEQSVGAYQVTLNYDPKSTQLSSEDIAGGTAEGFNTRPLVVRIDNSVGSLTLASFQVGSRPAGELDVARVRVRRNMDSPAQFGMHADEVTDLAGNSILGPGVDISLIRTQ